MPQLRNGAPMSSEWDRATDLLAYISSKRPKWMVDAACLDHDPAIFFPLTGDPGREARAICAGCPVQRACLHYAMTKPEPIGIWGGQSAKQRKAARRRSKVA